MNFAEKGFTLKAVRSAGAASFGFFAFAMVGITLS